jgi:hypothetical protein
MDAAVLVGRYSFSRAHSLHTFLLYPGGGIEGNWVTYRNKRKINIFFLAYSLQL